VTTRNSELPPDLWWVTVQFFTDGTSAAERLHFEEHAAMTEIFAALFWMSAEQRRLDHAAAKPLGATL